MYFLKKILLLGVKYGWLTLLKIIFFEIINLRRLRFFDYKFRKPVSKGEIYGPAFYYSLSVIKKKIQLKDKVFIDFGCGRGRVIDYMKPHTNKTVGVENNHEFKKHFLNEENVYFEDCYDNKFINELSQKYSRHKVILFFYHPFELSRIEEIIYQFRDLSKESIEIVLIGDIDLDQSDLKNNYIYLSKLIKIYKLLSK
jgi:hypothetical protein